MVRIGHVYTSLGFLLTMSSNRTIFILMERMTTGAHNSVDKVILIGSPQQFMYNSLCTAVGVCGISEDSCFRLSLAKTKPKARTKEDKNFSRSLRAPLEMGYKDCQSSKKNVNCHRLRYVSVNEVQCQYHQNHY